MEFKQRQPEVEKSQVTMALKMGQGIYGEVCGREEGESESIVVGLCRHGKGLGVGTLWW